MGCGNKIHLDWINIDLFSTSNDVLKFDLLQKLPFEDNCIKYIYHSHVLEHFSESEGITFLNECYRLLQKGGTVRIVVPDLENIIGFYINLIDKKGNYSESDFYKFHRWLIIELFDQAVREYPGGMIKECLTTKDASLVEFITSRIGPIEISEYQHNPKKRPILYRIKRKLVKMLLTDREYKALNVGLFRKSGEIHKWMYDKYSLSKLLFDIGFKMVEIKSPFSSNIPLWETYGFDVKDKVVLNPTSLYIEAVK